MRQTGARPTAAAGIGRPLKISVLGCQLERRWMSERLSRPPIQYAHPEDGRVNHG
jgi:hypothetical protein